MDLKIYLQICKGKNLRKMKKFQHIKHARLKYLGMNCPMKIEMIQTRNIGKHHLEAHIADDMKDILGIEQS